MAKLKRCFILNVLENENQVSDEKPHIFLITSGRCIIPLMVYGEASLDNILNLSLKTNKQNSYKPQLMWIRCQVHWNSRANDTQESLFTNVQMIPKWTSLWTLLLSLYIKQNTEIWKYVVPLQKLANREVILGQFTFDHLAMWKVNWTKD